MNRSHDEAGARQLSRRAVLAEGAALASAAAIPTYFIASRPARAQNVLTRYDASTTEGQAALGQLSEAIGRMKQYNNKKPKDPLFPYSYLYQAGIHGVSERGPYGQKTKDGMLLALFGAQPSEEKTTAATVWNTCVAHFQGTLKPWFLPWHRMYLYYFERIVQEVLLNEDPHRTFRVPYWNWCDEQNRALPAAFLDKQSPLYNGTRRHHEFPNWANVQAGEQFDKYFKVGERNLLTLPRIVRNADFDSFNTEDIAYPHDAGHTCVSDDMGEVWSAAKDPIFWLHHANVDRLWSIWLKTKGPNHAARANPSYPDWTGKTFNFIDVGVDHNPVLVSATTRDFLNTSTLGYLYEDEAGRTVEATLLAAKPAALATAAVLPVGAILRADAASLSGGRPLRLTFTPQPAEVTLRGLAAAADDLRSVRLTLHNVRASRQPGTGYSLYLDLPDGADASDTFWVGALFFFDNIVPPGEEAHLSGANSYFDITETAFRLAAAGRRAEQTSLTIVPGGDPATIVSFDGATISLS